MGCSASKTSGASISSLKRKGPSAPSSQASRQYIRYPDEICANDFVNPGYDALYQASIEDPAKFFGEEAKLTHWFKDFDGGAQTIDTSDTYLHRWFKGGLTNIAYNCLDRHVLNGRGDQVCFYEDSVYTGVARAWSYAQVLE